MKTAPLAEVPSDNWRSHRRRASVFYCSEGNGTSCRWRCGLFTKAAIA